MRIAVFATSAEALDNYIDAFSEISKFGGSCEIVFLESIKRPEPKSWGLPLRVCQLPAGAAEAAPVREIMERVVDSIIGSDPDVVFHCDNRPGVTQVITAMLRDRSFRGLIIGAQGMLAEWPAIELPYDRMLCFGPRHIARLPVVHQASAHPVGLPRLDRLRDLRGTNGGYAVFLGHRSPEPPVITATIAAFERHARLPVIVSDHPDFPKLYRHQAAQIGFPSSLPSESTSSTTSLLQHCNLVLATDSSAILDALYLQKPVVLLPNAGLVAFDGYPGISEGYSPNAIVDAARRMASRPDMVAAFLRQVVGGVRYDHVASVRTALERLLSSGPLRKIAPRPVRVEEAFTPAQASLPKISTRVELVKFIPVDGTAAELGVAKGVFSDEMLRARRDFHLYSIDRWAGDRGHDDEEFRQASALLKTHGTRCTIVRKIFDEALQDFAPGSLDLVYIDGYAHTGQEGGKTLEDWWSRVRPGGILAGHDYHPDWKLTVDAVDGFCRRKGLTVQTTSLDFFPSWYVQKPSAGLGDGGSAKLG